MAIFYSAELKPGGNFPLIDLNFVKGGTFTVSTITELNLIPKSFLSPGTLCYVEELDNYFKYKLELWEPFKTDSLLEHVFLSLEKYESIIPEEKLYFIIEEQELEQETWSFGKTFPIVFGLKANSFKFGLEFPIVFN